MTASGSRQARTGASIFLFLLLIAATAYVFYQSVTARIEGKAEWSLTAFPDEKTPPDLTRKLRTLLAGQPLDQATLNLLFAIESRGDMDAQRRTKFADTLAALGWRDTATQQNLIVEAVRNRDPRGAVRRADGLLRRGKLAEQIQTVLIGLETIPQAADLIIDRLAQKPDWRSRYFRAVAVLQNPAQLAARVQLFDKMQAQGLTVAHDELKPSLDVMVRAGRREDAARIALRANPPANRAVLNYDPDFTKYLALSIADRLAPLPIEWTMITRAGLSIGIAERDGNTGMHLRWNGRGAPIMVKTMVALGDKHTPRLEIETDGSEAREGLAKLVFVLICPGKAPIPFVESDSGDIAKVAHFQLGSAALCDYPDLAIVGRPQMRDSEVETTINAIRLLPAN